MKMKTNVKAGGGFDPDVIDVDVNGNKIGNGNTVVVVL